LPILMMYISKEQYEPLIPPSSSINNLNEHSIDFLRTSKPRRLIKLS
ncbi:unnamed protein product, partial [Rotaria sp. Silwood1]